MKSKLKLCLFAVATLVLSPVVAFGASFGTQNFFYAPSNVITPLPGFTTSWGNGASSGSRGGLSIIWCLGATTSNSFAIWQPALATPSLTLTTDGNARFSGSLGIASSSPGTMLDISVSQSGTPPLMGSQALRTIRHTRMPHGSI